MLENLGLPYLKVGHMDTFYSYVVDMPYEVAEFSYFLWTFSVILSVPEIKSLKY